MSSTEFIRNSVRIGRVKDDFVVSSIWILLD